MSKKAANEEIRKAIYEWPGLTLTALAKCYGISRQSAHFAAKTHNLTASDFANVFLLLELLTERALDSPFRRRLADPIEARRIQDIIYEAENLAHEAHINRVLTKWGRAKLRPRKVCALVADAV